jgi:hypothetical protein
MRKVEIGLSVYPDFYDFEVIKKQLEVAASLGYTRVFTSIQLGNLGFENTGDSLSDGFIELFKLTRKLGMKVHADLNLEVFTQIGAEVDNVKPIVDLNIDVIRLDGGFCIDEIVRLTANPYGLVIEDNTSNEGHLLETVETIKLTGNHVLQNSFARIECCNPPNDQTILNNGGHMPKNKLSVCIGNFILCWMKAQHFSVSCFIRLSRLRKNCV